MQTQALIIGSKSEDTKDIQVVLQYLDYKIKCVATLLEGIREISVDNYQIAIINETQLNEKSLPPLLRLNDLLPKLPLLVLSSQISVYAYRKIGERKSFVTLQKPFDKAILAAVVRKITEEKPIEPSILPRFITDEPASILVLKTGLHINSRMKNYSAGGAFFQYNGISLKVGDKIQIGIGKMRKDSADPAPTLLQAEVRWIREGDGPRSASRGIGVQFL